MRNAGRTVCDDLRIRQHPDHETGSAMPDISGDVSVAGRYRCRQEVSSQRQDSYQFPEQKVKSESDGRTTGGNGNQTAPTAGELIQTRFYATAPIRNREFSEQTLLVDKIPTENDVQNFARADWEQRA